MHYSMKTKHNNGILPFLLFVVIATPAWTQEDPVILLNNISQKPDTTAARIYFDAANLYYLKGMNDSAVYCYGKSLERLGRDGDSKKICESKLAMAKALMHVQKFDEATELLFSCIRTGEQQSYPAVVANARTLVAYVYNDQGKAAEALRLAMDAEKSFTQLKDTAGLLFLYPILVTSLSRNGDTVTGISYFSKGMAIFDQYEQSSTVPAADKEHLPLKRMALIFNCVNIMERKPDLLLALKEAEKVNRAISQRNNPYAQFELKILTAVINLKMKEFKQAQQHAEEAVTLLRPEIGVHAQLADVYHIIADASDSLGEYQKAYQAMTLFKQYNDSVFNTSSLEAIHSVEAKYETAKKEEKIRTLNKEKKSQRMIMGVAIGAGFIALGLLIFAVRANRLQKKLFQKEKEAQRAELEKEVYELQQTALRAQMNPHFIFNSLNSVQRYVVNHDVKGVNHYLSTFASLVRQTLENSSKPEVSLKDELQYLETYIRLEQMRSNDQFEYEISIDEQLHPEEIYIPNMIIQPFVENSILHGMPPAEQGKGKLRLQVQAGSKLQVIVEDNGPGYARQANEQTTPGSHRPMGSAITARRMEMYNKQHVEQISCTITNKADEGGQETGTHVLLEFPLT